MAYLVQKWNTERDVELEAPGLHMEGAGPYRQVSATGSLSWNFRFHSGNRDRSMRFGPELTIGLSQV